MGSGVCQWRRTKVNRCRNVERIRTSSKPGCHDYPGIRLEVPVLKAGCIKNPDTGHPCWKDRPVCCPTGDRYVGGVNVAQASIWVCQGIGIPCRWKSCIAIACTAMSLNHELWSNPQHRNWLTKSERRASMQVATKVKPNERREFLYPRARVLKGGRACACQANVVMER